MKVRDSVDRHEDVTYLATWKADMAGKDILADVRSAAQAPCNKEAKMVNIAVLFDQLYRPRSGTPNA